MESLEIPVRGRGTESFPRILLRLQGFGKFEWCCLVRFSQEPHFLTLHLPRVYLIQCFDVKIQMAAILQLSKTLPESESQAPFKLLVCAGRASCWVDSCLPILTSSCSPGLVQSWPATLSAHTRIYLFGDLLIDTLNQRGLTTDQHRDRTSLPDTLPL